MINIIFYGCYGLFISFLIRISDNIPEFRFSFVLISIIIVGYLGEKLRKKLANES